jgi:DNA polymerase sigma
LKFPEDFHLDYVNRKFEIIKRRLEACGYQYISGWRIAGGSRVLRFKDYKSDFTIDIGHYAEILVSKTNLIRAYQDLHPDIYRAIMLIKIWADRRELNNPSITHVINSYCHVLMFITYLIMIKAIPNLRTISPKIDLWEARNIDYYPIIDPIKSSEPDNINSRYSVFVYDGSSYIPIYFHKELDIKLGYNWDIKEAIQGYFHFMGYKFNYRTWDISIYHGGIVKSFESFDLIDSNTKLLRVRHPFIPDQLESKSALPWCVDGLKWEFMRGYQLLRNNDWNELYHKATPPSIEEIFDHNMYTYFSLYSQS